MRPVVACCLVLLGSVVLADRLNAQWHSDSLTNTPVCIAKFSQTHPDIASDGAGGAYIVWQDIRSTYNWDIYAQHLNAKGEALWGSSGMALCTENFDQYSPIIKADGLGGAFVVWENTNSISAQHIQSDGSLSYDPNGIVIGEGAREQRNPVMDLVTPGRAIVAFEDLRSANSSNRPDITINVLTPEGAVYGSNGYEAIIGTGGQRQPRIVSDHKGSTLLAWETEYGLPVGIQASLLDTNGALKWNGGGAAPGFTIFRGLASANDASNISLGISGQKFLLAWQVKNTSANLGQDIYANRVNVTGEKDWFAALEVTGDWPSDQANPTIVADDSSGFIIFFEDYGGDIPPRYLNRDIAAVRFRANGVDRIPAFEDGFSYVVRQSRAQRYYRMVEADNRFYFAWDDARASADDTAIYVQAVDKVVNRYYPTFGTASSWGKPIAVRSDAQQEHAAMCKRAGGGVIIAWTDNRSGDQDIYAQIMLPDGTLPVTLSSFGLKSVGEDVLIDWVTATEKDNAGFEIERRSLDQAADFEIIASYVNDALLKSKGNVGSEKRYSYIDQPQVGSYEYRIVSVDLDGTRTAHEAKQIELSYAETTSWKALPAYPDPADAGIIIPMFLSEGSKVTLEVRNAMGQMVLERSATQDHKGYSQFDLPTSTLANGSYMYRLTATFEGTTKWISPLQRFQIVR